MKVLFVFSLALVALGLVLHLVACWSVVPGSLGSASLLAFFVGVLCLGAYSAITEK